MPHKSGAKIWHRCGGCSDKKPIAEFIDDENLCADCRELDALALAADQESDPEKAASLRSQLEQKEQDIAARKKATTKIFFATLRLYGARNRARKRGLEFDLTPEQLHIPDVCPVEKTAWKVGPHAMSIDRIDNTRGYTPDNVIVVSKRVNSIKSDRTLEELRLLKDSPTASAELRRIATFYMSLSPA